MPLRAEDPLLVMRLPWLPLPAGVRGTMCAADPGAVMTTGGSCRFGTATALSDADLLEMNREEFLFAMQELPVFGLEMLHDLEQRLEQLKLKAVAG